VLKRPRGLVEEAEREVACEPLVVGEGVAPLGEVARRQRVGVGVAPLAHGPARDLRAPGRPAGRVAQRLGAEGARAQDGLGVGVVAVLREVVEAVEGEPRVVAQGGGQGVEVGRVPPDDGDARAGQRPGIVGQEGQHPLGVARAPAPQHGLGAGPVVRGEKGAVDRQHRGLPRVGEGLRQPRVHQHGLGLRATPQRRQRRGERDGALARLGRLRAEEGRDRGGRRARQDRPLAVRAHVVEVGPMGVVGHEGGVAEEVGSVLVAQPPPLHEVRGERACGPRGLRRPLPVARPRARLGRLQGLDRGDLGAQGRRRGHEDGPQRPQRGAGRQAKEGVRAHGESGPGQWAQATLPAARGLGHERGTTLAVGGKATTRRPLPDSQRPRAPRCSKARSPRS
jgi:hypothetical protein